MIELTQVLDWRFGEPTAVTLAIRQCIAVSRVQASATDQGEQTLQQADFRCQTGIEHC